MNHYTTEVEGDQASLEILHFEIKLEGESSFNAVLELQVTTTAQH